MTMDPTFYFVFVLGQLCVAQATQTHYANEDNLELVPWYRRVLPSSLQHKDKRHKNINVSRLSDTSKIDLTSQTPWPGSTDHALSTAALGHGLQVSKAGPPAGWK